MTEDGIIGKQLIDFFSQYNVEEANSELGKEVLLEKFGVKDRDELLKNKEYKRTYACIMQARQELDKSIKGYSGRDEVQSCLALLYDKKRFGKERKHELEILKEIIDNENEKCLFKSWDKEEQEFYKEVYSIIVEWYDFFFSHTTRNLPETNNEFRPLIKCKFGEDVYDTREINKKNFLAELIVRYLDVKGVKPFYDQNEIVCGDKIEEKIFEHCKTCYAFVQLIEEEVFHVPNGELNWCHKEFTEFDDWNEKWCEKWCESDRSDLKRFYYFLTHEEDIVFPPNIPPTYEEWYDNIQERKYVAVIMELNNFQLKRKVKELAKEIIKTKKRILKICLGKFI